MDVTEVEGKPLLQLLAGSSWESGRFSETLRVLAETIKRRESFSNLPLEVEICGQKRCWALSASPRLDEKGLLRGFRGVGSDITTQVSEERRDGQECVGRCRDGGSRVQ